YIDGRLDVARSISTNGLPSIVHPLRLGASRDGGGRLAGLMSGFFWSEGVRTDFPYALLADVRTDPSVLAGSGYVLTNPLPNPTLPPGPTLTSTVQPNVVDGGT